MSKSLSSQRAKARAAAKQRRLETRDWERRLLDLVASGVGYDAIADKAGVSVATVRRRVQRAIRRRPPEPAETFVALQRERLNKAMQTVDVALSHVDIRAVPALVALLPQLERYWGLQNALQAAGAQSTAPNPLKTLETKTAAPPLTVEPTPVES